jgi:hypothetical protein
VGFFKRTQRLSDIEVPRSFEVAYERSAKLSTSELLVWAESTSMGINRLLDEYRNTQSLDKLRDAHERSLELTGMLRRITEL